jgi:hypothetical protein
MAHNHANLSTMAVAGGMLLVSVDADDERNVLYDEGSGCFQLPHAMVIAGLASVPAAALAAHATSSSSQAASSSSSSSSGTQ